MKGLNRIYIWGIKKRIVLCVAQGRFLPMFFFHACESVSCLVLSNSCDPMNYIQPARLLCPWNSPGKNTGGGCHFLFQGIFPTQGLSPDLLHCRQILYRWRHPGPDYWRISVLKLCGHLYRVLDPKDKLYFSVELAFSWKNRFCAPCRSLMIHQESVSLQKLPQLALSFDATGPSGPV